MLTIRVPPSPSANDALVAIFSTTNRIASSAEVGVVVLITLSDWTSSGVNSHGFLALAA